MKALEVPDTNPEDELKLLNGSNEAWKQNKTKIKEMKRFSKRLLTYP